MKNEGKLPKTSKTVKLSSTTSQTVNTSNPKQSIIIQEELFDELGFLKPETFYQLGTEYGTPPKSGKITTSQPMRSSIM
eukprot:15355992-Ditylum_brightwellii.AAC.1